MAFSRADVHTSKPLDTITGKVFNDASDFIGHELLPFLNVDKVTGTIYVHGKENMKLDPAAKGRGEPSKTVERTLSEMSYSTHKFGRRMCTLDEDVEESDTPIRMHLEDDAEVIAEQLRLIYEQAVYTKVTTSTNYATSHSTSLTNEWDDYTNGDPIGDIRTGRLQVRNAIGKWPNFMAMSSTDFESLKYHPDVKELYVYTGGLAVNPSTKMVANVFGLDDIFVANSTKNTATEGQADALSQVWGENAVLFYRSPSLGRKSSDFGRTLVSSPLRTRSYRQDDIEGTWTDTDWKYGLQWMAVDAPASTADSTAGYLIANVRS